MEIGFFRLVEQTILRSGVFAAGLRIDGGHQLGHIRCDDPFLNLESERGVVFNHMPLKGLTCRPDGFVLADKPKDVFLEDGRVLSGEGKELPLGD